MDPSFLQDNPEPTVRSDEKLDTLDAYRRAIEQIRNGNADKAAIRKHESDEAARCLGRP